MSRQLPNERGHHSGSTSTSAGRRSPPHSAPLSAREPSYSSLGEALGGARPPGYMHTFQASPSSTESSTAHQINPDSRYNYNHSSGMASAYEYPAYPASPYDAAQYSHAALPPMRSASSQPQSPPSASQYYSQVQYGMQPPAQQWAGDTWAHTSHSFSPSPAETTYVVGRGEPAASPQGEPRSYSAQHYPATGSGQRPDERHALTPELSTPQSRGKERERNPSASDRAPRNDAPFVGEFTKLRDAFRHVMTGCSAIISDPNTVQGRPPSLEDIDRMLRSAHFALQTLDGASIPPISSPERKPSTDQSIDEPQEPPANVSAGSNKRQKVEAPAPEGQTCLGCGATSTPEWRRGPLGPRTLCNACGLVYAKLIKKRSREVGSNSLQVINPPSSQGDPSAHPLMDDDAAFSEGGSDDEQSFGSQDRDRRSDGGDFARRE